MKRFEIAASILGRQFKLLTLTIEQKETEMAKQDLVKVKIIDSFGQGYANGKEYDVTPEEAKRLIDGKKAIPVGEMPKENASSKEIKKAEKR